MKRNYLDMHSTCGAVVAIYSTVDPKSALCVV